MAIMTVRGQTLSNEYQIPKRTFLPRSRIGQNIIKTTAQQGSYLGITTYMELHRFLAIHPVVSLSGCWLVPKGL